MSDFVDQSQLDEGEISGFKALLLDRLADGFTKQWENQVAENLHSTRAEYMRGMYTDRPDEDTVVMGLSARRSKLAVAIELGKEAFDEKVGFEKSPKKTMKKDGKGWYITVPFRHAVPFALGESSAFTSTMPLSVYRLVRRGLKPAQFRDLPTSEQVKGTRPEIVTASGTTFPAYLRKTARYEGLFKIPEVADGRGGYFTFRRVSDLSDANSWIHPGFLPRNLLQKALDRTDVVSITRQAKRDFFSNNE
jgi:hypothetical protein